MVEAAVRYLDHHIFFDTNFNLQVDGVTMLKRNRKDLDIANNGKHE